MDITKLKDFTHEQRLFTYKVAHDGGNAPNPFHGLCTLAICKPVIRRVAKLGDVIVGLACGDDCRRIVYCMVVDESVPWADYINRCNHNHIKGKIPENEKHQGDCIWTDAVACSEPIPSWSQHVCGDFSRDVTRGQNVLIGKIYWYFGKGDTHEIYLPDELEMIIPQRGHRSNSNCDYRESFVKFFNETLNSERITHVGLLGRPKISPSETNKQQCHLC